MWKNTAEKYGLAAKLFHWLSALTIIALFILGYWMVELDYYSQWYKTAPHWHQSIGFLLFIVTLLRLIWRALYPVPNAVKEHNDIIKLIARLTHLLLYSLLLLIIINGYLISTADERSIEIFTWFELPSLGELFNNQEEISGSIHKYSAYILIFISFIHTLGAFKHHFIDKDATLLRMLK